MARPSGQALADKGKGELGEAVPGGSGDVTQGSLAGEHGQSVHGGPDGVLDALPALRLEHARIDQFVERGTKLTQGRAIMPGSVVRGAVGVLLRHGERGGEQSRFLVRELQVRGTDRAEPSAGRVGITVRAGHAGHAGGHAVGELAHGGGADRSEELVTVGEVPVGRVRHHAHHPCRFPQHNGVRAAGAGQLEPGGDQAVADSASRPPPSLRGRLVFRPC